MFTKEQRLKGLMKQLKNLGYDAVPAGGSSATATAAATAEEPADMTDRGAHKLDELVRNEEAF